MGLGKAIGGLASKALVKVNKVGRGQNSNFITRILRGQLKPIRKFLRTISDHFKPGFSIKNSWKVWKRHGVAQLVNIRRNILKHPWRFAKTKLKSLAISGVTALALPMIMKAVTGGSSKAKEEDTSPEQVPSGQDFSPQAAAALDEANRSRKMAEESAKNSAKAAKEQRRMDIDSKIAEVKSQQVADSSLKGKLAPINSNLPDNLEHIYARTEEANDQNKAIIDLLNRANDIALDNNKVGKKAYDLEKAQLESGMRKSSDLYQILQRMKSESESANSELNNIKNQIGDSEKRITMKNAAEIGKSMKDKFKANKGKGIGLLSLMALGFLATQANNIIEIFKNVKDTIVQGFEGSMEFLRNIGQSIGLLRNDTSTLVDMKGRREEELSKGVSKADPDDGPADKTGDGIVTQEDYRNEDGEIDKKRARQDNVNVKHDKKSTLEHAIDASEKFGLKGERLRRAFRYATSKKVRARRKIEWEEALEEIKEQAEKRAQKAAEKAKLAAKEGADDVVKKSKGISKKVSELYGKVAKSKVITGAIDKVKKFAIGPAVKGLSKIIGKENAEIVSKMILKIGTKLGQGVSVQKATKTIPYLGTIFHITDAIDKGFKRGDWLGAFIEAVSAVAQFIPVAGPEISAAIDAFSIGRDIYRDIEIGNRSEEADNYLQEKAKKNEYVRNQRGDLLNEIIRKYNTGKESDTIIKDKAILGVKKVDEEVAQGKYKRDSQEYRRRINEELKNAGADIKYDESGNLTNLRQYSEDIKLSSWDKRSTEFRRSQGKLISSINPLFRAIGFDRTLHNWIEGARKADWADPKKVNKDKRINKTEKSGKRLEGPVDLNYSPFGVEAKLTANYLEGGGIFGIGGHKGIDVVIPANTQFTHPFYGEVVEVKKDEVSIRDTTGYESKYAHIRPNVKKGQRIEAGKTKIGQLLPPEEMPKGMRPHLHYQSFDLQGYEVNPFRYFEGDESLMAKGSPTDLGPSGKIWAKDAGKLEGVTSPYGSVSPIIKPPSGAKYSGSSDRATVESGDNYKNYGVGLYNADDLNTINKYGRIRQKRIYGGKQVDGLTIDQRALFIMNKLIKDGGLSPVAAAALTGVWWAESGLDPHIVDQIMLKQGKGKHEIGQGIAQWTWGRVKEFRDWHKSRYGSDAYPMDTNLNTQVDYALYDMSKRSKLMQVLRTSQNVQEVVDAVLRGYENGGFSSFADIPTINRLYARGGGYEGLMRGRMKHTGDALDILRNSSGISLPQGIMDSAFWSGIGGGNIIFGDQMGMQNPNMPGGLPGMPSFDPSKSIEENFSDKMRSAFDALTGNVSDFGGESLRIGNGIEGGSGGMFNIGTPMQEMVTYTPDGSKEYKGPSPNDTNIPLNKNDVKPYSGGNKGWGTDVGKIPTINAPTIKGGDNNVTNVNNIYLSNNFSKAAEMM